MVPPKFIIFLSTVIQNQCANIVENGPAVVGRYLDETCATCTCDLPRVNFQ